MNCKIAATCTAFLLATSLAACGGDQKSKDDFLYEGMLPMTHASQDKKSSTTASDFCDHVGIEYQQYGLVLQDRARIQANKGSGKVKREQVVKNITDQQRAIQKIEDYIARTDVKDNPSLNSMNQRLRKTSSGVIDAFNTAHKEKQTGNLDNAIRAYSNDAQSMMMMCLDLKKPS